MSTLSVLRSSPNALLAPGSCSANTCGGTEPSDTEEPAVGPQARIWDHGEPSGPGQPLNVTRPGSGLCGACCWSRAAAVDSSALPVGCCPLSTAASQSLQPQGLGVAPGLELGPTFPLPCPDAHPDTGLPDASKGSKKPLTPCGQVTKGLGQLGAL